MDVQKEFAGKFLRDIRVNILDKGVIFVQDAEDIKVFFELGEPSFRGESALYAQRGSCVYSDGMKGLCRKSTLSV